MSCKDCINADVCFVMNTALDTEANDCSYFKDRSRFVELPDGAIILTKEEIAALSEYEKKYPRGGCS